MKRIVICCDGTWQDLLTSYPTNVVKTVQAALPTAANGIPQIVYYDQGLGTKQMDGDKSIIDTLTKLGGGGIGLGIDHKIQDAYRFLSLNYEPGDDIYLFGFSRGAYTVRCIAGMIYNSGLIHRRYVRRIPEATSYTAIEARQKNRVVLMRFDSAAYMESVYPSRHYAVGIL